MVSLSVSRSVCQSVGLLNTFVSPSRTAEPIEMPFGLVTRVGPRNHVLDGVQISPQEGALLRGVCAIGKHCESQMCNNG